MGTLRFDIEGDSPPLCGYCFEEVLTTDLRKTEGGRVFHDGFVSGKDCYAWWKRERGVQTELQLQSVEGR